MVPFPLYELLSFVVDLTGCESFSFPVWFRVNSFVWMSIEVRRFLLRMKIFTFYWCSFSGDLSLFLVDVLNVQSGE